MAVDAGRELLLLGMLRRTPMSAYDLARAVKSHSSLYRTMARGNPYAQLARLEDSGLIVSRNTKATRGPHEMKTVYRLSAAGRARFNAALESVFEDVQASDATLEIACVLLGQLPRDRARELLARRLALVAAQEKRLARLLGKPEERSGAAQLMMMHAHERLRGEGSWLRESIALLKNAKWQPGWVSDDEATAQTRRLP